VYDERKRSGTDVCKEAFVVDDWYIDEIVGMLRAIRAKGMLKRIYFYVKRFYEKEQG